MGDPGDPAAAAAFVRCPGCDLPMHPSMLYEIAFSLVAVGAIVRWGRRDPGAGGPAQGVPACRRRRFRFLVEFVRGNEVQALGLTGPQLVLVPLVALLALHFVRQARVGAWRLPPAPAPGRPDFVTGGAT